MNDRSFNNDHPLQWEKGAFTISTDKKTLDLDALHAMLSQAYWAKNRSLETIRKSSDYSICFCMSKGGKLVGFARVLTDQAVYAVVLDMIIDERFQGQGLGRWLLDCICEHPRVAPLRQVLWTTTADDFYRKDGFVEMERLKFMARNWNV